MCGVPYHAAEGYIARLIQKGYRVAICDQMEDPRLAKKLVKREITRIVTPGHRDRSALLRSRENNYLAAVCAQGRPRRAGARRCLHRRVPRHRDGRRRSRRGARTPERARSAVARRPAAARRRRPLARFDAPSSKTGSSRPTTPTARCASTSSCCRSMAAAWPSERWRSARRAPSCTTCATRRAPRSTTSTAPPTTTAPSAWCSTPSPCATSNWSSRCSPRATAQGLDAARRARPDRDRHGRPPAAAPAAAAVAGSRRDRSAARRGGRTARSRPSCAPSCARRSAACSIWSACWPRSRWARPDRATCWPGPLAGKIPLLQALLRHAQSRAPARRSRAASTKSPKCATAS